MFSVVFILVSDKNNDILLILAYHLCKKKKKSVIMYFYARFRSIYFNISFNIFLICFVFSLTWINTNVFNGFS